MPIWEGVVKIVCGLGNPGPQYERTRHNAGFMVLDKVALQFESSWSVKWDARIARVKHRDIDVLLVEPLTFMNLSGFSLSRAARYHRVEPADILVVHDDVDLPLGRLLLKENGGDNGHRGIRSVIEQLGSRDFPHLRVGVGRPSREGGDADMVGHVLSAMPPDEWLSLGEAVEAAVKGVVFWVGNGTAKAQNRVNRKEPRKKPSCPAESATTGPIDREEVR